MLAVFETWPKEKKIPPKGNKNLHTLCCHEAWNEKKNKLLLSIAESLAHLRDEKCVRFHRFKAALCDIFI